MTGFSKLFFGSSKTTKEASAGSAAGVHNVPTKLFCTAQHKSDDLNGVIKFYLNIKIARREVHKLTVERKQIR